jgi:SAM-dependent methyltransferase
LAPGWIGFVEDAGLVAGWQEIWDRPVSGWDFSRFGDRLRGDSPPWSYVDLAREALAGASSVLDLGTGGGEVLLSLADALPADTTATEGWAPNLPVARRALAPRGIEVVPYDAEQDAALPFPDERFDVVLDRHEAYDAREVARVLGPGGVFLTQQVDGRDLADLADLLGGGGSAYQHVRLDRFVAEAEAAGLVPELATDWSGELFVADVDTLVGYLAMTPWTVEGFTVESHAAALLRLHRHGMPARFTQRRFVLRARRPG